MCLAVLLSVGTPAAYARAYTVAEVESLCDGIVGYKDGKNAQHFINNGLCDTAGVSAEFYIIALSQRGYYDFSAYENALLQYLKNNEVYSATSREKYALALIASGSTDSYISKTADEAIGGQGLMSLVFGLHILNNGYQSRLYSVSSLVNTILSYQLSDGGWAVIGSKGDVDVTAMTLQALAPYYRTYSDVNTAVNRALELLSNAQQADGGFYGMGVENCESIAQVLTALSDLGIDQNTDSRFIKNGNTVLDAMTAFRNADGSFAHTGSGFNETATLEAHYAMTAYLRYRYGKGSLYILDRRRPAEVKPVQEPTQAPKQEEKKNADSGNKNNSDQQKPQQNDTPKPQTTRDNNDRQNAEIEEKIIYINGQAYREVTDSNGNKETVAVKGTEAQQSTDATQASAQPPTEPDTRSGAGIFQPTATASAATADEAAPIDKSGYKPYAIGGIVAAAGIAALILFLLKKRNKKHYIAVAIIMTAGILFVLLTNFESTESYHTVAEKTDTTGTVTLSVKCDTLKGEKLPEQIPADCVILDDTTFAIAEGDTVYNILYEASGKCHFQVDNRGAAGTAYIAGIEYLYEFDYGDLSGWMYKVNGEFPDVGCQGYVLHDGDRIEWLYTRNIGKDL